VAPGRSGAAGGGVVDRHGHVIGHRQAGPEREGGESRVALLHHHVRDADAWLVVDDSSQAVSVGNRRVVGAGQVDGERFVRLGEPVAVYEDGDGLAGLSGGEGQRAGGGLVVAAGGGGAVGGGVADRDGLAARRGELHGEQGGRGADVS